MSKQKIVIIGGGTINHVTNHFGLVAPAYGTTANQIRNEMYLSKHLDLEKYSVETYLTKMCDKHSKLETNQDVSEFVDELLNDNDVKCIVFNVAMCDFEPTELISGSESTTEFGKYTQRLKTSNGDISLKLRPSEKVISKIRIKRPDIFLIGFKTTFNMSEEEQFYTGLKFMKSTKCNLVLCNDTGNHLNMVITPEETKYNVTTDRKSIIQTLVDMTLLRLQNTFTRTNFVETDSHPIQFLSESFQTVIKFLINNGGFIENNGNGFTPSHFCQKVSPDTMISSCRKANHNNVFQEGMTKVVVDKNSKFTAYGNKKPSVGARSQWMLLNAHPEFDCIVHTHNPKKDSSNLSVVEQYSFNLYI